METGDVVFFRASNTWISRFISKVTSSPYTHVGLALDDHRIIEADRFIKTRIVEFEVDESVHVIYRIEGLDEDKKALIYRNAIQYQMVPYDYIMVIRWFFRLVFKWNIPIASKANQLVCSELIDYVLVSSEIPRKGLRTVGDVTPKELLEVYDLKEVKSNE